MRAQRLLSIRTIHLSRFAIHRSLFNIHGSSFTNK
jgi:hypothetical protein